MIILHSDLPDAGITPHTTLDRLATDWLNGIYRPIIKTNDVTNPPTDAELDSAFGTPAHAGKGFIGVLDDNGAGANVYLCLSDGTNWWLATLTKAM